MLELLLIYFFRRLSLPWFSHGKPHLETIFMIIEYILKIEIIKYIQSSTIYPNIYTYTYIYISTYFNIAFIYLNMKQHINLSPAYNQYQWVYTQSKFQVLISTNMGRPKKRANFMPKSILLLPSQMEMSYKQKLVSALQDLAQSKQTKPYIFHTSSLLQHPSSQKLNSKSSVQVNQNEAKISSDFYELSSIYALLYISSMQTYSKIYGQLVVDEEFNILYADDKAKEIYESSLNAFQTHTLLDLIVLEDRDNFVQSCNRSIQESSFFKYLTYSRMSTRKYGSQPQLENFSNLDYFFRYMKILRSQIIPVVIDFSGYQQYQNHYWNHSYLGNGITTKCFVIRTSYENRIPNLNNYDFRNDKIIKKMQFNINKKKVKKGIEQTHRVNYIKMYDQNTEQQNVDQVDLIMQRYYNQESYENNRIEPDMLSNQSFKVCQFDSMKREYSEQLHDQTLNQQQFNIDLKSSYFSQLKQNSMGKKQSTKKNQRCRKRAGEANVRRITRRTAQLVQPIFDQGGKLKKNGKRARNKRVSKGISKSRSKVVKERQQPADLNIMVLRQRKNEDKRQDVTAQKSKIGKKGRTRIPKLKTKKIQKLHKNKLQQANRQQNRKIDEHSQILMKNQSIMAPQKDEIFEQQEQYGVYPQQTSYNFFGNQLPYSTFSFLQNQNQPQRFPNNYTEFRVDDDYIDQFLN